MDWGVFGVATLLTPLELAAIYNLLMIWAGFRQLCFRPSRQVTPRSVRSSKRPHVPNQTVSLHWVAVKELKLSCHLFDRNMYYIPRIW